MFNMVFTLNGVVAAGLAAGALALSTVGAQPRPGQARTAAVQPTPGQLQILNKEGKPAGLCPLKHTDVTADVSGFVARVNVRQEFSNPSSTPIEAVYTFPLPDDAAVDDMTMYIGKRVIQGEIKRREEARDIYENARAMGQAAALLDQERPNIFTQSVANIMPGEKVVISISYVNLLKYDDGTYEFSFPMVVGPRYVPQGGYTEPGKRGDPSPPNSLLPEGSTTAAVTDADKITPPITPKGTRAGHDISLSVKLDAGFPLRHVESVLHKVSVARAGQNRATVRLKSEAEIPNRDFILRFRVAGDKIQSGLLTHADGSGGGYFTLILQPPSAPPQSEISAKEMVFVIDQTGSQSGQPIDKSKETIRYCLQNLNRGDTFQILGFNTEVYPCFQAPVPVNPENIRRAQSYLDPLKGSGGTDILKAMDYALMMPHDPARLRIIIYMTDGYVGNDMQILDYIRKNRGQARVFPFGIGNSVNRFLIEGMAREGRGVAEIVTLGEDSQAIAKRFYTRIASPILLDPQITWNGLPVTEVFPEAIPDVFTSRPIIVKGRYTKGARGSYTLSGYLRGKPYKETLAITFPDKWTDGAAIPTLWAREKIEHLQSQDWMGAQTGQPVSTIKDQIIETALNYRLMSQYTSFVAVEQTIININGQPRKVDVPVEMPDGVSYEGIFSEDRGIQKRSEGRPMIVGRYSATPSASLGLSGGMVNAPAMPGAPVPAVGVTGELNAVSRLPGRAKESALTPGHLGAFYNYQDGSALYDLDSSIALGKEEVLDKLNEMKPEDRKSVLQRVKLDPSLHGLAEKVKADGKNGTLKKPGLPEVVNNRVTIQIWLNALPKDGLDKLKALGFESIATLRPNQLILGSISVDKLDDLLALDFVRRVEPPKFKD